MVYDYFALLLALPIGFLIARLAHDELAMGKKWFLLLTVFGCAAGFLFLIEGLRAQGFSSLFIALMAVAGLTMTQKDSRRKKH